jgi:hypothetical protein
MQVHNETTYRHHGQGLGHGIEHAMMRRFNLLLLLVLL